MSNILKYQIVMFIVMTIVGICFNAMNALAFSISHLYFSYTLFYGGCLMASNMIWAHEIIHYLVHNHINIGVFLIGLFLSLCFVFILRQQFFVNDEQYLKRMISHHSTALTTSYKILETTNNPKIKKLSKTIIETQKEEIQYMKSLLNI